MGIEVFEYNQAGFDAVMTSGTWAVGILNCAEEVASLRKLERHMTSDEAFVLLEGTITLYIGLEKEPVVMEKNKVYRIPKQTWHATVLSSDAKMLVVENSDVTTENSEYIYL